MKKILTGMIICFLCFSCSSGRKERVDFRRDRNFHRGALTEWQYLNGIFCAEGDDDTVVFTYIMTQNEHQLTLKPLLGGEGRFFSSEGKAGGLYTDTVVMISDSSLDTLMIFGCDSLRLFTSWKGESYDFLLRTETYPVFIADSGVISLWDSSSYYYSIPRMSLTGTASGGEGSKKVSGYAWFDHQWGNFILGHDSYIWFSINLDSGYDCMVWRLAGKGRSYMNLFAKDAYKSRIRSNGWFSGTGDAEIENLGLRRAYSEERVYPFGWRIKSDSLNADILILPQYDDFTFAGSSLYQGRCTVEGILGGERVGGICQMEITGYYDPLEAGGYVLENSERVYRERVQFFRGEIEKKLKNK